MFERSGKPRTRSVYSLEKSSMVLLDSGVSTTAMQIHNATMTCVSSSISLAFSLTMIIFYFSFKNLRKGSRGYLVMINICDFSCSLSFLFSSIDIPFFQSFLARLIEVRSHSLHANCLGLRDSIFLHC